MGKYILRDHLRPERRLKGTVREAHYTWLDGDWNLIVTPAQEFERLAFNSHGLRNAGQDMDGGSGAQDGDIECEIEPIDDFGGGDNERIFFEPLEGKEITIVGVWVDDDPHEDKTEIHPITSIEVDHGMVGAAKLVEVFVFSDDSASSAVFFTGKDRRANFSLAFPQKPAAQNVFQRFDFIHEIDRSARKSFIPREIDNEFFLDVEIQSGRPRHGKGFYHAKVLLWFDHADLVLRYLRWSPKSFFQEADTSWSVVYDVNADLDLARSSPGVAEMRNVVAKLRRRDQREMRFHGNPSSFQNLRLTRDKFNQFDYEPVFEWEADVVFQDGQVVHQSINRVINLPRPEAHIELWNPPVDRPGRLKNNEPAGREGAPTKKAVWTVNCSSRVSDFIMLAGLGYDWKVRPSTGPSASNRELPLGAEPHVQFDLEYALPDKNVYDYHLELEVKDGQEVERAIARMHIRLPRPTVEIIHSSEPTRAPESAPTARMEPFADVAAIGRAMAPRLKYRFNGTAAPSRFLLGSKSYRWTVKYNGRDVDIPGRRDLTDFSFDFNYDLAPGVGVRSGGFGGMRAPFSPGPSVTVEVTDEAEQSATATVDAALAIPEVGIAVAREILIMVELLTGRLNTIPLYELLEPPRLPTGLLPPGPWPRPSEVIRMLPTGGILTDVIARLNESVVRNPEDIHSVAVTRGASLGSDLTKPGRAPQGDEISATLDFLHSSLEDRTIP